MTLREIHERCKARHLRRGPRSSLCRCGELWPCPDNADAVAALAIPDDADERFRPPTSLDPDTNARLRGAS